MKLCLLGDNGSVHVQKWIEALSRQEEVELDVITFGRGARYENVRYYFLNRITHTKLDYVLNIPLARSLVQKINPDIVHSQYATSYGLIGAALDFHPYVITGWGADIFDSPRNLLMKRIVQYSFSKADALTVLSEITRKEMQKLTGKQVMLIPFGVDLSRFTLKKERKTDDRVIIGTIRTLSSKYGVEYLIRAFAILSEKYEHVFLEIVGDGPQRDYLMQLTRELKIEKRVKFHGYVSQMRELEKYIGLFSRFDIFAILSTLDSETFGVAAVEASALQIPVVASDIGGLPEVIDDGITGFLVPPKDPVSTAGVFEKLVKDGNLRRKMGENGRAKVEKYYDWQQSVQKMMGVYRDLLAH